MAETLTKTRLQNGRYEGVLSGAEQTEIEALHRGSIIGVAELSRHPSEHNAQLVTFSLPSEVLSDGVQVIGLRSSATGVVLDRITLMSGAALDEDIRAEISLLRDELELLKAAFRRHCAES